MSKNKGGRRAITLVEHDANVQMFAKGLDALTDLFREKARFHERQLEAIKAKMDDTVKDYHKQSEDMWREIKGYLTKNKLVKQKDPVLQIDDGVLYEHLCHEKNQCDNEKCTNCRTPDPGEMLGKFLNGLTIVKKP